MTILSSVAGRLSGAVNGMLGHRNKFPEFVNRSIDWVAENPTSLLGRIAAQGHGPFTSDDVPPPLLPPAAAKTVLIGPTNYAGQGWAWARAIDSVAGPGVAARNLAVEEPAGFAFPANQEVKVAVYQGSESWQAAQYNAATRFTHVMFEAERPLFGRLFGRDIVAEEQALRQAGVSTAFMCHGTDIRLPSRHGDLTQWSPYLDSDLYTGKFEREAARNRKILDDAGRPVFVSTPDLLLDVPYARWCPVVVEPERWRSGQALREGTRPVVVHIPSRAAIKGTHLIEPAMIALAEAGEIEYVTASDVPAAHMPEFYSRADIVLDQFRIGSYGVAACEAMAAGRVVVGHVAEPVRKLILEFTGRELPVVEANPDTLAEVLRDLIAEPERMAVIGSAGIDYVDVVHSGPRSVKTLLDDWIVE